MCDALAETVAGVLGLSAEEVTDALSVENSDAWDSVKHFSLILQIEEACDVRFSSEIIPELTSVGRIRQELRRLNQ